ncbi:MAG: fumarylacetoacetase [Comamonadaceae bacterium BICA1-1]|nr:MAG: fumarylacetoacetase [Comamonadaceae bacterium BICA1-1]
MYLLNETHDPALKSWVESAQLPGTDFPIQNLPFAVLRRRGTQEPFRGGVAIGDQVLDLAAVWRSGALQGQGDAVQGDWVAAALQAGAQSSLNALMALGAPAWSALRLALSRALRLGSTQQTALQGCLLAQSEAEYTLPARIGDYTDFYTSIHHATNVGKLMRPDNPLLPNYHWVPIGYHGRASSVIASGQPFQRPQGQIKPADAATPMLAATRRLDFELELGAYIGPGNALGEPIALAAAEQQVFGLSLLNDWSARDLQAWEYQPLGPFLGKNFATTVSPWVITLEALAPYRTALERSSQDPAPLPYLDSPHNRLHGALDIELEVALQTPRMREQGEAAATIVRSNSRHAYWTLAQMVAHHSVNGCNLQPGDLLGTGTLSGPQPQQAGALIELTLGGRQPLALPGGEARTFLEDGDTVWLRGCCQRPGAARIGFGDCTGTVLPARA